MTDQAEPHPRPACMECGAPLDASTTVWPLNDDGKRRHLDTGYPCGHVQLDTTLDFDGPTIGQMEAASAAHTIRLAEGRLKYMFPPSRFMLRSLADAVEAFDGTGECPLCGQAHHLMKCPLRTRTVEVME